MSWPLSQDYNEAIQSPAANFADADLKKGQAVANALGLPIPFSGNFADVYQVRCPDGSRWAVKCFTRETPGLRERYQEISAWLRQAKMPFTVEFSYLEQGIRVHGKWRPVLKMQWVEGLTLNQFVSRYIERPAMLEALLQLWAKMGKYLRVAQVGHCDLQHGNILLVPGSTPNALALKLIDYDGMWIPPLAKNPSGEVGHANYQHPRRLREGTYSLEVDRFPLLLVATAMRALKADKSLWARFDNGDNMLFKESDLADPNRSELFQELSSLPDPGLVMLAAQVRAALKSPLEATALLEDAMPDVRPPTGATTLKINPAASVIAVSAGKRDLDFDTVVRAPGASFVKKGPVKKTGPAGLPAAAWISGAAALIVAAAVIGGVALWAASRKTTTLEPRIVQKYDVQPADQDVNPPPADAAPVQADPAADPPTGDPPVVVNKPDESAPSGWPFGPGWDRFVNPDHDCKFVVEKNALTIELPGKDHDLGVERNLMNAPRFLRDVEGDFTAEVQVDGEFKPSPASTTRLRYSYLGAGLTFMADERTYCRLERASLFPPNAANFRSYPAFEVFTDGKKAPLLTRGGAAPNYANQRTQFRLRRQGGRLTASVSQDNENWTEVGTIDVNWPAKLKVGIMAVSTSQNSFQPRFDNFRLTAAGKTTTAVKPAPVEKELRQPPRGDDLAKAREAVQQDHKADYAKLNTPKERSELAGKLRTEAFTSKDEPDRQYALLVEARDLAARGEDLAASQRIINETAATFAVDPKEAEQAALLAAGASFSNKAAAKAYVAAASPLLQEAKADDDYDRVAPLLPAVRKAAAEAHDANATRTIESLVKLQKEYEVIKTDLQTLKDRPDDADANLAVGKFYSYQKQDWDKGDPYLAKSGNLALATAATDDVDAPTEVAKQVALADAWMKLADNASDVVRPSMQRRAFEWYSKALPNLSDKEEKRVKARVVALTKQFPDISAYWGNLDVSKVQVIGNSYLRMTPGQMISTKQPTAGAVEIILVARTAKAPPSFEFLQGKEIVVEWEVRDKSLTCRRPRDPAKGRDAFIHWDDVKFMYTPNVWVTYSCKITAAETDTYVNSTHVVFDQFQTDVSKPKTIQLLVRDQTLDVKSFTVNPLD